MPVDFNSTAIADSTSAGLTDTGLSFIAKAGRLHTFRAQLVLLSAATTTGPAVAVDTPASPTLFTAKAEAPISTTAGTDAIEEEATVTDAEQMTFTTALSTQGTIVIIEGAIIPSVAGEVKIQFNTEVNGSAVTYKGGKLEFTDLGIAA
jgi:hypothetical protein